MEMKCGIQWHGVALINDCDEESPEVGVLGTKWLLGTMMTTRTGASRSF